VDAEWLAELGPMFYSVKESIETRRLNQKLQKEAKVRLMSLINTHSWISVPVDQLARISIHFLSHSVPTNTHALLPTHSPHPIYFPPRPSIRPGSHGGRDGRGAACDDRAQRPRGSRAQVSHEAQPHRNARSRRARNSTQPSRAVRHLINITLQRKSSSGLIFACNASADACTNGPSLANSL
jgi:hypothetical protein